MKSSRIRWGFIALSIVLALIWVWRRFLGGPSLVSDGYTEDVIWVVVTGGVLLVMALKSRRERENGPTPSSGESH